MPASLADTNVDCLVIEVKQALTIMQSWVKQERRPRFTLKFLHFT